MTETNGATQPRPRRRRKLGRPRLGDHGVVSYLKLSERIARLLRVRGARRASLDDVERRLRLARSSRARLLAFAAPDERSRYLGEALAKGLPAEAQESL